MDEHIEISFETCIETFTRIDRDSFDGFHRERTNTVRQDIIFGEIAELARRYGAEQRIGPSRRIKHERKSVDMGVADTLYRTIFFVCTSAAMATPFLRAAKDLIVAWRKKPGALTVKVTFGNGRKVEIKGAISAEKAIAVIEQVIGLPSPPADSEFPEESKPATASSKRAAGAKKRKKPPAE